MCVRVCAYSMSGWFSNPGGLLRGTIHRHCLHHGASESPCDSEQRLRALIDVVKTPMVSTVMIVFHELPQFPSDAIPHFCCLCEWEVFLKILYWLFPYFELHWLAIVDFMAWVYVPRFAGSPNLAGRQQYNLESFIHSGERGPYSVLEKLPVAADWIVYHALVPLFLDFGWASVQTGGKW